MQKFAALSLLLVCAPLVAGMRVGTQKSTGQMAAGTQADSTSKFDLLTCDQMCMQCPGGRNILIQRQKSGARSILAVGAGLVSFGWGFAIVNQLAGCDKIGFQFWQDHKLAEEQPLETQSTLGVLFVHSGLEALQEYDGSLGAKVSDGDRDALEHCESLSGAYVWQALHGAFENGGFARQQEFARKCLSHSQLCGSDSEWDQKIGRLEELGENSELKVSRLNPFAHQGMCAAPKEGGVQDDDAGFEKALRDTKALLDAGSSEYEKALRDAAAGEGAGGNSGEDSGINTGGEVEFKPSEIATDAMLSAVTVEEAGKVLDDAADAMLSAVTSKFCRSDDQQARCAQLGWVTPSHCTDRCCLDVCNFHFRKGVHFTKANCISKCTKGA